MSYTQFHFTLNIHGACSGSFIVCVCHRFKLKRAKKTTHVFPGEQNMEYSGGLGA